MVKKRISLIIAAIIFASIPLHAEYLFLTDGSIIKGSIVKETPSTVTFHSEEDKKTAEYRRERVMRVLYTELNMGRLYVQLKNGDNMRVFMVDEDRDSYTFRKEINKPEEFKIERADVLFVAERNPSKLKGKAGYTDIKLEWYPPFDEMDYYNIYIKNKKAEKFVPAAKSDKNLFHLKNLKGNTKYFIAVTGIDERKDETPYSNVLEISTLNTPPSAPAGLKVTSDESGAVTANWQTSVDIDGSVEKYKVYVTKDKKKIFLSDSKDTAIKIKKTRAEIDRVQVTAIDNNGAESKPADIRGFQPYIARVAFTPAVIYPFGKFAELGGMGCGGFASFMMNDLFYKNTVIGLEAGYFYMPGIDSIDTMNQKTGKIHFAPFGIKGGYQFTLKENFYLTPSATLGAAYLSMDYINRDQITGVITSGSSSGLDMMALASVEAGWHFSEHIFAGLQCGYGILFEADALLQFASAGLNIGWRF